MMPEKVTSSVRKQSGFGFIEVLVAMGVLTIALMGLLSAFAFAMQNTHASSQDLIAKQLASEAMESIFTARNTAQISWMQIQNVGAATVPDGIFLVGLQPINLPGADGMIGTADDAAAGPKRLVLPGPNGIVETPPNALVASGDDVIQSLANFQRSITILPVAGTDALRTITVTVQYSVPPANRAKTYVLTGYISQYR